MGSYLEAPNATEGACLAECNSFCGTNANVLFCKFKGQNITGNCDVECKNGDSDHIMLTGAAAIPAVCVTECDSFCGTNEDVLSCMFKGQNLKGNCDVECKNGNWDHIMLVDPNATEGDCVTECNAFCGTSNDVLSCRFKGENLMGNCDVACKTGESDHITLLDPDANAGECVAQCNAFCSTNDNVLSCVFKGHNLKGNCEVTCRGDASPTHIMLLDPDANASTCLTECGSICDEKADIQLCEFKGTNLWGWDEDYDNPESGTTVEGQINPRQDRCVDGSNLLRIENSNEDSPINGWWMSVTGFKALTGSLKPDSMAVNADASGVTILHDWTVRVEAKQWVDRWNYMAWDWEWQQCKGGGAQGQAAGLQGGLAHHWRFDYPLEIIGGQYSHRFTLANDDAGTPMAISGLTILASPGAIPHDHLDEIDLGLGTDYDPFPVPTEWSTNIVTPASYIGGYIYFKYDISEYPGGPVVCEGFGGHPITEAQCAVTCKDGTVRVADLHDPELCRADCLSFCGTVDEVAVCNFKGDLIATNVPAVTEWGMVVMVILVLAAGAVVIKRARALKA